MKILSIILACCFSLNVFAQTNTIGALEKSFNEYQYALTVEWDQKDEKFLQSQNEIISKQITTLMNEGKVSKENILAFAEKKMANKQAFEALKLKVSLMAKTAPPEEIVSVITKDSKEFFSKGASWNGEIIGKTFEILGYAMVAYILYVLVTFKCEEYGEEYQCHTETWYNEEGYSRPIEECGYVKVCLKSNQD